MSICEILDYVFYHGWLSFLKNIQLPSRNKVLNLIKIINRTRITIMTYLMKLLIIIQL